MTEIRALTVRQPWAWAIIHGGKDVENRSRNIAGAYRGPVLIHAGLRVDLDAQDRSDVLRSAYRHVREQGHPAADVAQRCGEKRTNGNAVTERYGNLGGIIGTVDLVDVHHTQSIECHHEVFDIEDDSSWFEAGCSSWGQSDCWHLVFDRPRLLPDPIPYKGRLGLWRIDTSEVPGLEGLL